MKQKKFIRRFIAGFALMAFTQFACNDEGPTTTEAKTIKDEPKSTAVSSSNQSYNNYGGNNHRISIRP